MMSFDPRKLRSGAAEAEARGRLPFLARPGAWICQNSEGSGGIFERGRSGRGFRPVRISAAGIAEMARRDWIAPGLRLAEGRAWLVTAAGASAAARLKAEGRRGAEPGASFREARRIEAEKLFPAGPGEKVEKLKVNLGESPVGWLARRKGPDGAPFLTSAEVEAAERLRVDYERGHMGARVTQDWRGFLTAGTSAGPGGGRESLSLSAEAARGRVMAALKAMGPDLSDAAFRVCCQLEGLEIMERDLGMPARSGKLAVKWALKRLVAHYAGEEPAARRS
ncbi:DUF6456 domain-containing protein [Neomegalonema sp.]|uniref:DUF6456 domain-containing protein n=1 Tax=Neomegalonema sp. TaxID=2039713 RepID=UPI002636142D|nr:DUF6456 domain-containing protein [Neomegalonema sp.]MDD2869817.1 DUF6456 domain-containing protein [Neomegalonema sp.]